MNIYFFINFNTKQLITKCCQSKFTLLENKTLYELCECNTIRAVYCKEKIHVSVLSNNIDFDVLYLSP